MLDANSILYSNIIENSVTSTLNNYFDINSTGVFSYDIYYSDNIHYLLNEYNNEVINFYVANCNNFVPSLDNTLPIEYKQIAKATKTLSNAMCTLGNDLITGFTPVNAQNNNINMCNTSRDLFFWIMLICAVFATITIAGFGILPTDIIFGIFGIIQLILALLVNLFLVDYTNNQKIVVGLIFALTLVIFLRYLFLGTTSSVNGGGNSV
jgi:hypothetical protein